MQKVCYNELLQASIPATAANANATVIPDAIWNKVTSFQEIEETRRLLDTVAGYRLLKEKASNIRLDIANILRDYKDLDEKFHDNDLNEVLRGVAGDLVENVELIDEFTHPKTKRLSKCFRIRYRSMDRSLTNAEIDSFQEKARSQATKQL